MSKQKIHFNISERKILLRVFDIVFVLLALHILSSEFDFDYFTITKENWTWVIVLGLYLSGFGTIFELYDLQNSSKFEKIITNIIITSSVTVLFYLLTPILTPFLPGNRLQILYFYLAITIALILWRSAYIMFIISPRFYKKALIVGEASNIKGIIEGFNNVDPNYIIVGFINCEIEHDEDIQYDGIQKYAPDEIQKIMVDEQISEIVIASYDSECITPLIYHELIALLESGFPIREYTQVYEDMTYRVPVQYVGKDFYKYFPFSRNNQNKLYLLYRHVIDIMFSLLGIFVGIVLLPFILLGNSIANKGPLFYRQERVGKGGKLFTILKFRTMIKNAEQNGVVWAEENDSRVTSFGKILRRSRIDELPQCLNILKGDMSLIGPRPERPYFVKELSKVIPFYETRHIIKPGITGWAQVNERYGASVDASLVKLQYDLYYIKHRSFFLDLNVMVKTFSTVVYYRGQ